MAQKRITFLSGVLILILFFTACSSPKIQAPAETAPIETLPATPTRVEVDTPYPTEEIIRGTISIRHSWNDEHLPILVAIIKNFQAYYPNVMFDVLNIPSDALLDRYLLDTREGLGPTILFGPAEWGPPLFEEGLIANLHPYFQSSFLEMLNQPALESVRIAENLIGLPYLISGVVLYRNKDIVTITPQNFTELVTLAQTSTQGANVGAFLERSFFYSGAHLNGLGGQLIDQNNLPGFNNGKGVEWLRLLKDFEQAGAVNFFSDADLERFKQGTVGWIIDGTWNYRSLADAIGPEKLVIDQWPTYGNGRLSGYVTAENVYLSAKVSGDDQRAAVKFIEYMLSSEAQTLLIGTGRIPASVLASPTDPVYGTLVQQAMTALGQGTAYPVTPDISIYSMEMDVALRDYFSGNLTPEEVLQNAQDRILADLAKQNPTPAP